MHIVITGANRGIGLELTQLFLARGDSVHATARAPQNATALRALSSKFSTLKVHELDVGDDVSTAQFGREIAGSPVDVLINNAGVGATWRGDVKNAAMDEMLSLFNVNALGALRVTKALLPNLEKSKGRVFHVSSRMGSIGDNTSGGAYSYRMSKAALNMAAVNLALELKPQGIASIVFHPGWVQTDMGGPSAPLSVHQSAASLVKQIDKLGLAQSGHFFSFDGEPIPW